jgi:hypothetical protein
MRYSRVGMRIPIHSSRVRMMIHIHLKGRDEDPLSFAFLKGIDDDPHSFLESRDQDSNALLKGSDADSH